MPYSTPGNYFEDLKGKLMTTRGSCARTRHGYTPYYAVAAMLTIIFVIGSIFLGKDTATCVQPEKEFITLTEEDYILYSDEMINTIIEHSPGLYAEDLTDNDYIEYIIYTGTEVDEFEQY